MAKDDQTTIKTRTGKEISLFKDESLIEIASNFHYLGDIILPNRVIEEFKKFYFSSGLVRSRYLYINGEKITDGVNYNKYAGI